jgi:hypothetical protein
MNLADLGKGEGQGKRCAGVARGCGRLGLLRCRGPGLGHRGLVCRRDQGLGSAQPPPPAQHTPLARPRAGAVAAFSTGASSRWPTRHPPPDPARAVDDGRGGELAASQARSRRGPSRGGGRGGAGVGGAAGRVRVRVRRRGADDRWGGPFG